MKKNLFTFNLNNFSVRSGSYSSQETCEQCSSECEKIEKKINNRKLSELKDDDIDHVINVFGIKR